MTKKANYLDFLKGRIKEYELLEDYEMCAELLRLQQAIEKEDVKAYMKEAFDLKEMRKIKGFFPSRATIQQMEERIKQFFSLETIFEYSYNSMEIHCHITQ